MVLYWIWQVQVQAKPLLNAKMMYALSEDESLRYNFALGLRTLTLQTERWISSKLFQNRTEGETELAILIGSSSGAIPTWATTNRNGYGYKINRFRICNKFRWIIWSIWWDSQLESVLETLFSFKRRTITTFKCQKTTFSGQSYSGFNYWPFDACNWKCTRRSSYFAYFTLNVCRFSNWWTILIQKITLLLVV